MLKNGLIFLNGILFFQTVEVYYEFSKLTYSCLLFQVVEALLSHGAPVNAQADDGNTALHDAVAIR